MLRGEKRFLGKSYGDYEIDRFVAQGRHGMVFHATDLAGNEAACKILESDRVRPGWEMEAKKAGRLVGVPNVVQYKGCGSSENDSHVYLLYEFIHGKTLKQILREERQLVTIQFVENLADKVLSVCHAIRQVDPEWSHGDLHESNIMISDLDSRLDPPERRIVVTDFGIGGSINELEPKNDLLSLARIIAYCLTTIEPAELGPEDRFVYDHLSSSLLKRLEEHDPTVPLFSEPAELRRMLVDTRRQARHAQEPISPPTLNHPFDYLSCEQLGDTPLLLTRLFSPEFLGHPDLVSRNNLIFTGPRGCGKTTVFRNLSLRDQILAGQRGPHNLGEFIGIYYQSVDLRYAFPYEDKVDPTFLKVSGHYFSVVVAGKIFDTLALLEERERELVSPHEAGEIQLFVDDHFPEYSFPPLGTPPLTHISRFLRAEKLKLRKALARGVEAAIPPELVPLDFLKSLCSLLSRQVQALSGRPFFIFVDDYSVPKVKAELQLSLNRIVFQRNPELYFKMSTESIVSIILRDSDGNELEEGREFETIDLGARFTDPASKQQKGEFIAKIVNQRLDLTKDWYYKDIAQILGSHRMSYNEMARRHRKKSTDGKGRPKYYGFETLVDLCSGDIAQIFLAIRDMIDRVGGPKSFQAESSDLVPLSPDTQDASISRLGGHFLERIGKVRFRDRDRADAILRFLKSHAQNPDELELDGFDLGIHLRRIVQAIGDVAHWELMNIDSKNVTGQPPKQASRLEIRDPVVFPASELEEIYSQLIQYGILIRDVRGKSLRGAVVPRLQLRRLLIPKFRLTFSHRDSIGLSLDEFLILLSDPNRWASEMKRKKRRTIKWREQTRL